MIDITPYAPKAFKSHKGRNMLKDADLKFINKVGIEIEGGWPHTPNGYIKDQSLSGLASPVRGEVPSPPLLMSEVEKWVKMYCPIEVNQTCGLHIHVSFKNLASYLCVMEQDFYDLFLIRMDEWGKKEKLPAAHQFWYRLKGNNHFCKRAFNPAAQVHTKTKGDHRYTHLNYCYDMHGTIECRLFPGFKEPELIISAVNALVSCYEEYLEKNFKKLECSHNYEIIEEAGELIEV